MTKDEIVKTLIAWVDAGLGDSKMVEPWPLMPGAPMFTAKELLSALNYTPTGWQDISTLPELKDGFECMVLNDRGQFAVEWDEDWGEGGWWMVPDGKFWERPLRGSRPTHWMPLHPPPHTKGGEE